MKALTRTLALLFVLLVVLVGISVVCSWKLDRNRQLQATASSHVLTDSQLLSQQIQLHDQDDTLQTAASVTQELSLLLCFGLCAFGICFRRQMKRDAQWKADAESALASERSAAERRIEDRTLELRQEVEERRRAEELNRGQKQVLEMLASPGELKTEDILQHLVETIAAQSEAWLCSVHLAERGGRTMRLAGCSSANETLKGYLETVGSEFQDAPEIQACLSGQPRIVAQLTEVRRTWSELLTANGVFSACSIPFRMNQSSRVAGTLTVYSKFPEKLTTREQELVETAARMAALVVEHRRIHAELVRNAYQDALTALPNRRAGEQAIEESIQKASRLNQSVAVLWIDINRFKRINDQYGHNAGDVVLRTVSERLRRFPAGDGSVARMGEDEFLVLVPGPADAIDPIEISRKLGAAISKPIHAGSALISLTASIGACMFPQDGATVETLERNAVFAMYRAKSTGTGFCAFSLAMSEESSESLEIEEALGVAIEENYLRLVYQPLYSQGGELTGFEALLRFHHPRLGNISPARFIPIAEETRLIVPIGNWVLRQACRQLRTWHDACHRRVHMAVNISALQFARDDFADTVANIFSECGLSPEYLILELTESVVMEDYDAVVRQMTLLKQCGIRIAMDDFGTGYSSLSYIHRIPIDLLKIDRSFIERVADPEGTRPIVEAVIAMARHLGLQVVAEGVETTEQQKILQQAGCHSFQGFLFARPLSPEDAENCLTASIDTPFANPLRTGVTSSLAVA
ncbi:MAG TPA: GGDEF domain-containing protein [Terracidiphilus sp.]|nr:GGDEF domain-containing protein [Terracidiphilus sp.]